MDFGKFSYWSGGVEGKGCGTCQEIHGLVLDRLYTWEGFTKDNPLPYICASKCAVGYAWRQNAKRCVKIVTKDFGTKTQSEASLSCAKDNGRLLSIESCSQFEGLKKDLWTKNPSLSQKYWVGYHKNGFDNYHHQQRTSEKNTGPINSRGQLALEPGGDASCTDEKKLQMFGATGSVSSFGELIFPSPNEMRLLLTEYTDLDTPQSESLCEKDKEWTCEDGYTLFQESCYKVLEGQYIASLGHLKCIQAENARLSEIPSKMHQKFLNILSKSEGVTNFWVGFRRHVQTTGSSEDNTFVNVDHDSVTVASLAGSGPTDDCVEYNIDDTDVSVVPCNKNASVICEKSLVLSEESKYPIPSPKVFLPLILKYGFEDLSKSAEELNDRNVAFSHHYQTQSSAHFMGTKVLISLMLFSLFIQYFRIPTLMLCCLTIILKMDLLSHPGYGWTKLRIRVFRLFWIQEDHMRAMLMLTIIMLIFT